jgi:two-component sensor histidine kinase
MIIGLYFFKEQENQRVMMLLKEEERENTTLLEKIIQSKSNGLKTFSNDYSYWDEMVLFTQTRDSAWASANIAVSLQTYDVDYVWTFDREFLPFYFTRRENAAIIDSTIITKEIITKLTSGSRFFHYFMVTTAGIVEISGATIHPTSDPKRLTEPQGYFVAGRLWSGNLTGEISGLTGSAISLININNYDNTLNNSGKNEYTIECFYTLNSWEGKSLVLVLSTREVTIAKLMHAQSDKLFAVILVFVTCILVLLGVSLYYLVNLPLNKITRSLKENNTSHLSQLRDNQNEFGEMAKLVNEFFVQREKLLKEIEVRTEAEGRLLVSEEELKHSLNEKVILLKEVHHRVKNNLQIIISLIRLQSNKITNNITLQHLNATLNRIKSIAFVHEMLYRSTDLSKIDFNVYISKFAYSLKDIYISSAQDIKLDINVKDIFLGVDKAVPCGIIINELVTNSIKHAFNGSQKGIINISMEKTDGVCVLRIADNGVGICKDFDLSQTDSLGMYLVTSLANQLNAELEIESNNGTVFTLKFHEED